tara:strand:- start:6537 stop:8024 length:1488 start_codon:yes stop_codon:yes gene_type:complete
MQESKSATEHQKAQVALTVRRVVFISHCNPEDNALTAWYGARLSAAGYEVWSDMTRLLGGEEMWRDIDEVMNHHARKVIVLLSRSTSKPEKEGARAELDRAHAMRKKLGDRRFVIPVKIDDVPYDELPSTISNRTIIPAADDHAAALAKILKILEEDSVQRLDAVSTSALLNWQKAFLPDEQKLENQPDLLVSNWMPVESLPDKIRFYEINKPLSNPVGAVAQIARDHPLPMEAMFRMLITFAEQADVQAPLEHSAPVSLSAEMSLDQFLNGGTEEHAIHSREARKKLVSLLRQGFDALATAKGLQPYALSERKLAWYAPKGLAPDDKVSFIRASGVPGWRKLSGKYGFRDRDWHFGATATAQFHGTWVLKFTPHVVYTDPEGKLPPTAQFRRAHCKQWYNAEWRDRLYAFATLIADDDGLISLPMGSSEEARFHAKAALSELDVKPASKLEGQIAKIDETDGDAESVDLAVYENDPAFRSSDFSEELDEEEAEE